MIILKTSVFNLCGGFPRTVPNTLRIKMLRALFPCPGHLETQIGTTESPASEDLKSRREDRQENHRSTCYKHRCQGSTEQASLQPGEGGPGVTTEAEKIIKRSRMDRGVKGIDFYRGMEISKSHIGGHRESPIHRPNSVPGMFTPSFQHFDYLLELGHCAKWNAHTCTHPHTHLFLLCMGL